MIEREQKKEQERVEKERLRRLMVRGGGDGCGLLWVWSLWHVETNILCKLL